MKPDVAVPEKEALATAYLLAVQHLQARNRDPLLAEAYQEAVKEAQQKRQQLQAGGTP